MGKTLIEIIESQPLFSIAPELTINDTVEIMSKSKSGTLLVLKGRRLQGLISERDLIQKVLFSKLDPAETTVESIMSKDLLTVKKSSSLVDCLTLMKEKKLRNLPVMGWFSRTLGLVTNTQVLMNLIADLELEKKRLESGHYNDESFQYSPRSTGSRLKDLASTQTIFDMPPNESVMEAIQVFSSVNVGCVPITSDGQLVGIFSERDLIKRIMTKKLKTTQINQIKISEVMTSPVLTVDVKEPVENCLSKMNSVGCRHLPILEDGKMIGIVSIVDCLSWIFDDALYYSSQLNDFMAAARAKATSIT